MSILRNSITVVAVFLSLHGWGQTYDLGNPLVIKLPRSLDEISGIVYERRGVVYAIADNDGKLYKLDISTGKVINEWKYHASRDFEDLVKTGNTFFVLNSNGNIKSFQLSGDEVHNVQDHSFALKGKNEFEILYYDKKLQKLVIICKDCSRDKKKEVSAFLFDPARFTYKEAGFKLMTQNITGATEKANIKFKPSAASIHPITGETYIISSINKLLVTATSNMEIKKVYALERKIFKQPEGLTFMPNGDMVISNERAGKGRAELLIFRYNPDPAPVK